MASGTRWGDHNRPLGRYSSEDWMLPGERVLGESEEKFTPVPPHTHTRCEAMKTNGKRCKGRIQDDGLCRYHLEVPPVERFDEDAARARLEEYIAWRRDGWHRPAK